MDKLTEEELRELEAYQGPDRLERMQQALDDQKSRGGRALKVVPLDDAGKEYAEKELGMMDKKDLGNIYQFVSEGMMDDSPETKYKTDKELMFAAYEKGRVHIVEEVCQSLLDRVPDDAEVWRTMTMSRMRLKLWDAALESAQRWKAMDPYSLNPHCAEAIALAGCQQFGEARARLAQLAKEVEEIDYEISADLKDALWRVDELWKAQKANEEGECTLSGRLMTYISGMRPAHYYLPDFQNTVGPLRLENAAENELGGGQKHRKKVVVTRDVAAGELLFVQNPLAFGPVEIIEQFERLSDALVVAASTSPRAAAQIGLLASDEPLAEPLEVQALFSNARVTAETWQRGGKARYRDLQTCKEVVNQCSMRTGQSYFGIWALPGLMRHSCHPSATHVTLGDTMVCHANRDLKAGDEVTLALFDINLPFEERAHKFQEHGFTCRCERCEFERSLKPEHEEAVHRLQTKMEPLRKRCEYIGQMFEHRKDEMRREALEARDIFYTTRTELEDGLIGLSDKVRQQLVKGRWEVSPELLKDLNTYLPRLPPGREWVKVPDEVMDGVTGAVGEFVEYLETVDDEQERHYLVASATPYFMNALEINMVMSDPDKELEWGQKLLPALAYVAKGSWSHIHMASYLYWLGLGRDSRAIAPTKPDNGRELAPKEREEVMRAIEIRYGKDYTPPEVDVAIDRILESRFPTENWVWEVSWGIGVDPERPNRGFSQHAQDAKGRSLL